MTDTNLKYDGGKLRPSLILGSMYEGVMAVVEVGEFGANKYKRDSWLNLENAEERYSEALLRHVLKAASGEWLDPESKLPHLAHAGWNCLALLTLHFKNNKSA